MKEITLTILLAASSCAAFAQNAVTTSVRSNLQTQGYLKEIAPGENGKLQLILGEVATGVIVARLENGTCVETRSKLVRMEEVTTDLGTIQKPNIDSQRNLVPCP